MNIQQQLLQILPQERIKTRYIDLISYASDAGFYHLIPKAVVQVVNEQEIVSLFAFCHTHQLPIVFRTAGTSLSGQSVTNGILVDLSQYWNKVQPDDAGELVRVQPGITGAMVNAHLRPYKRKIGPDPSSINAAMMGGILSNNASGMCCGVKLNSYHTTRHLAFILPDGKRYSTENPADYQRFISESPMLSECLRDIRQQILQEQQLYDTIRHKYLSKTTVGYSLNAFVDYEHPLDIMAHLLIGGEGTLAFIAEAVLQTVPDFPFKATALLYFPGIYEACQAIVPLSHAGAMMVELMDRASLHAVENVAGMPAAVKTLPPGAAALLVEFQEDALSVLNKRVEDFLATIGRLALLYPPEFTQDAQEQALLWKVRKGLFPAVGAVRASGSTVILEDVAFPVEKLGDAIVDLQQLFLQYHYHHAIIFGHAKDGNIHFVVTQSFNTQEEIIRYDNFIRAVVHLVVKKYAGTLKAEHGTGRNMAPFVETEWGKEAYTLMKRIKQAADPHGILNPGVIINEHAQAHITHLKSLPSVETEVDKCIECGYCEHRCPSRNLTTTPRRRIVIRRELARLKEEGNMLQHKKLAREFQYDGLHTCAVDGLCATACPVDINTGDLVKRLRREQHEPLSNYIALMLARNFNILESMSRLALQVGGFSASSFGHATLSRLTGNLRKLIPSFPQWSASMPQPADLTVLSANYSNPATPVREVVYFPACISRLMGTYPGKKSSLETFLSICQKTGIAVVIPEQLEGSCCSQVFSSKGYQQASIYTANKVFELLWKSSREGRLPVVADVSSCTYTLQHLRPLLHEENRDRFDKLSFLDSVDFLHDIVMPVAEVLRRKEKVVLHPVCATEKMKTTHKLLGIARHFAREVIIPTNAGCCGMAGDRGFLFPELTVSATTKEAEEVRRHAAEGYYASTRTCELALSTATGNTYESILHLVDEGL